jgi:hypothetical protein
MNLEFDRGSHCVPSSTFPSVLEYEKERRARTAKSSVTQTLKKQLCIVSTILLALSGPLSAFSTTLATDPSKLTVEQGTVQLGMTYDAYIKRVDHKKLTGAKVEASEGSGVSVRILPHRV